MNNKTKGMIIDSILLSIYALLIIFGIYILYEKIPNLSRIVAMLIIIISIPIIWGYIICICTGKKTIGYRLVNKK